MVRRARRTTEILLLVALATTGCGSRKEPEAPVGTSTAPGPALDRGAVSFTYDSLDERPVSADAMRGKPTVIAFVTTWDLSSQAQVDFLIAMAKHDAGRVNYAMVALEERPNRELVEVYAQKLGVAFPVALADKETIAGGGPFGDVHAVPTTVVLDRAGRLAWQKVGLAKPDDIRAALSGL